MPEQNITTWRNFLTYSGVKLPLKLTSELQEGETENRNTWFRAGYDAEGKMLLCQKMVYGEVEMEHRYSYYPSGALQIAEITMVGETNRIDFADTE